MSEPDIEPNNLPQPNRSFNYLKDSPLEQQGVTNSEAERKKLTKMIMRLFDHWELNMADQLKLLGLSADSQDILTQYRKEEALPDTPNMQERMGWLLLIHQNLRALYPENSEICYGWVKISNLYLNNSTPLDIMKKEGSNGIYKVVQLLEQLVEI